MSDDKDIIELMKAKVQIMDLKAELKALNEKHKEAIKQIANITADYFRLQEKAQAVVDLRNNPATQLLNSPKFGEWFNRLLRAIDALAKAIEKEAGK